MKKFKIAAMTLFCATVLSLTSQAFAGGIGFCARRKNSSEQQTLLYFEAISIVSIAHCLSTCFNFSSLNCVIPTGTIATERTVFFNFARSDSVLSSSFPSFHPGHRTICAWKGILFFLNHCRFSNAFPAFGFLSILTLNSGFVVCTEI